jgi:hypothetical protein
MPGQEPGIAILQRSILAGFFHAYFAWRERLGFGVVGF